MVVSRHSQHHALVDLDACGSVSVRCISTTAHLSTFWGAPVFVDLANSRRVARSAGKANACWPCGSKDPMSAWSASITASIPRFLAAHAPKDGPVALRSTMWRCSELTEQCGSVIRKEGSEQVCTNIIGHVKFIWLMLTDSSCDQVIRCMS